MEKELLNTFDKELLLKDLCARLPYGVKLQKTYDTSDPVELYLIDLAHNTIKFYKYKGEVLTICDVGDIERFGKLRYKPYLFPLSNMTEEERIAIGNEFAYGQPHKAMDILHQRHIDYRGLISMGLAVDATGLNIY